MNSVNFLKKVFSIGIVLIVSWSVIFPLSAWASILPIQIQVDLLKDGIQTWDFAFGAPDIAICIESDYGSQCLPEGTNIDNVRHAECNDSFTCVFSARVPREAAYSEFKVTVIDVDQIFNDLIGTGFCAQGKVCSFGKAKVQISKVEDEF